MEWRIPLTQPQIGVEEIDAVIRVLQSRWLTMGPFTAEFEQEFAAKLGVRHAVAVSSCTAALHLANLALGITAGDEVICPALTFVASANATRYTGADVVFADVLSADDLTISPEDIERGITARTRAITVVHYAGFACHMDEILDIARRHDLFVIEDCAHAPFAKYRGAELASSMLGTIGDIGCFSFFSNKNMTTGEGGMVTTNNDDVARKVRLLRSHGMTTSTVDRHRGHAADYDVVALGYNYRMDEIRAALGLVQLSRIDQMNELRRSVFRRYQQAFAGHPDLRIPFSNRDIADSACHILPVLAAPGKASEYRRALRNAGVQTSRHYDLIPSFSAYRTQSGFRSCIDTTDLFTLPLSPSMQEDDVEFISSVAISAVAA